jgi:signal transduction histidine kinase
MARLPLLCAVTYLPILAAVIIVKNVELANDVQKIAKLLELQIGTQGLIVGTAGEEQVFISLLETDEQLQVRSFRVSSGEHKLLSRTFLTGVNFSISETMHLGRNFYAQFNGISFTGDVNRSNSNLAAIGGTASIIWLIFYFSISLYRKRNSINLSILRAEINQQIAHDIKAPLTALQYAVQSNEPIQNHRELISISCSRIRSIADELLYAEKFDFTLNPALGTIVDMASTARLCVIEKRGMYKNRPKINITMSAKTGSSFALIKTNKFELMRAISNLVDNAVEATDEGEVSIHVETSINTVILKVRDSGEGMAKEIVKNLGKKGFSFGKNSKGSGSGLGVFHAKTFAKNWRGTFEVESQLGAGTCVKFSFPRLSAPFQYNRTIDTASFEGAVLITNSPELRPRQLESLGLKTTSIIPLMLDDIKKLNSIYLKTKQFLVFAPVRAEEFQLAKNIIETLILECRSCIITDLILTNLGKSNIAILYDDHFHRAQGLQFYPDQIIGSKKIVLLENDTSILALWKSAAKRCAEVDLKCFSNAKDLINAAPSLSIESFVYLDVNLGKDSPSGLEISNRLRDLGFENLYLCTGSRDLDIKKFPWIRGIQDKKPPWLRY